MQLLTPFNELKAFIYKAKATITKGFQSLFSRNIAQANTEQKVNSTPDQPIESKPLKERTVKSGPTRQQQISSFYRQNTDFKDFTAMLQDEVTKRNQGEATFLDTYLNRESNPAVDTLIDSYLAERGLQTLPDSEKIAVKNTLYPEALLNLFNLESFNTLADNRTTQIAFKNNLRLMANLYQLPVEKRRDFIIKEKVLSNTLNSPQTIDLFRIALSSVPQSEWPSLLLHQNFPNLNNILDEAVAIKTLPHGFLTSLFQVCLADEGGKAIVQKLLGLPFTPNAAIPPLLLTLIKNNAVDTLTYLTDNLPITARDWQNYLTSPNGYTLLHTAIENNDIVFAQYLLNQLEKSPRECYYLLQKTDQQNNNILHLLALHAKNNHPQATFNTFFNTLKTIFKNQPTTFEDLIKAKNQEGYTPLLLAVEKSQINLRDSITNALNPLTTEALLSDSLNDGNTLYHLLAKSGNIIELEWAEKQLSNETIKQLLLTKNKARQDPLHTAFQNMSGAVKGGNLRIAEAFFYSLSTDDQKALLANTSLPLNDPKAQAFLKHLLPTNMLRTHEQKPNADSGLDN